MARKPRNPSSAGTYHFIARGVNKKKIFHKKDDYSFYMGLVREYAQRLGVSVYHYCILSNHLHLIIRADSIKTLGDFGHFTHRRYAYYYCKTYRWSEQVFRRNFLSIPIEDDAYLLECGRYIERNPLDAGLVKKPEDYPYSSYRFYALGEENPLLEESPAYLGLAHNKKERRAIYSFYVGQERKREIEKLTIPF
jgi:putative transposase